MNIQTKKVTVFVLVAGQFTWSKIGQLYHILFVAQ